MQKFIWDLDETLLSADFRKEDDFFKYDIKLLSEFLTLRSGLKIDEKIIEYWNEHNKTIPDRKSVV